MVVALVFLTGGHWALLQVCAWTGMVVSYSQTESFTVALQKTFSGEHPCKLCKVVKEGRKAEQEKPATIKIDSRFEFIFAAQVVTIYPPRLLHESSPLSLKGPCRHDPPLLRPPIFA